MKKRMQKLLVLMAAGAMLTANVAGTAVSAAEVETAAEAGDMSLVEAETAAEAGDTELAEAEGAEAGAADLAEAESEGADGEPDAAAEEESEIETEAVYEEAQTMYMLDDAYVREAPDTGSEAFAVAHRGESITVLGEIGAWYHVRIGGGDEAAENAESAAAEMVADAESVNAEAAADGAVAEAVAEDAENEAAAAADAEPEAASESGDVIEGYVVKKCISADSAEAEAAVEAQEYAVKLAEEEAARAAQAAAQAAQAAPKGRHEVSRQRYDDCDGSGHGYYEIQYSDGTTEISEY